MRSWAPAVVGAMVLITGAAVAHLPVPTSVNATDDWSSKAWTAAQHGDTSQLQTTLRHAPDSVNPDSSLGRSINRLLTNFDAQ